VVCDVAAVVDVVVVELEQLARSITTATMMDSDRKISFFMIVTPFL
jgi:hypothetical protein